MNRTSLPWPRLWRLVGLLALLLGAPAAPTLAAEPAPRPGALLETELDLIPEEAASVIVNLDGAMLQLVTIATRAAEPEVADLISKLERVRVRLAEVSELPDPDRIRLGLRELSARLARQGWQTVVRARDEDEEVAILQFEREGRVQGVTVLLFEPDGEAGLIHLLGEIDPSQLSSLAAGLHIDALSRELVQGTGIDRP